METHSKNKQCHTHNNKYTYLSLHQLTISSSGLCQATGLCLALCRKAFYSVWFALCVQMQLGHRAIMANLWLFGPLVSWSVRSVHMCVVCACVSMCCEYVCMWEYVCVCVCMCMYVVKCLSWAFLKPDRLSDVKLEYRITIFLSVILSWKQYDNVKQDNWSVNSCKCFLQSQFTGLWMPAVCLSNLLPGLFMISWLWHWIRSKMSSFFALCEISLA